jgi:uncharacterized repeat protein (TIGR01451 family)
MSATNAGSPNPVAAGANITYTQVVTNSGPSAADNATVVAVVPTNTTFVSMTAPVGWSCLSPPVGGTGSVVCTNANMAGSTIGTFTLVVKVNSADEYDIRVDHASGGVDLRGIPGEPLLEWEHCSRFLGYVHSPVHGECRHSQRNCHHRHGDGECYEPVLWSQFCDGH